MVRNGEKTIINVIVTVGNVEVTVSNGGYRHGSIDHSNVGTVTEKS